MVVTSRRGSPSFFASDTAILLEEQAAAPDNFEFVVGMAQLSFRFGQGTVLHVGGAHDFEPVIFGGYRSFTEAILSLDQRLGSFGMLRGRSVRLPRIWRLESIPG